MPWTRAPELRDSNDLKDGALAPYLEVIEEGLTRWASPPSTISSRAFPAPVSGGVSNSPSRLPHNNKSRTK